MGPEAGALSLAVDEGSSTTITTTNPQPEKSRLAKESFVSDRVLDESTGQVCLISLLLVFSSLLHTLFLFGPLSSRRVRCTMK